MTIRRDNNLCPRLGADHANGWVRKNSKEAKRNIAIMVVCGLSMALSAGWHIAEFGPIGFNEVQATEASCTRAECVMPLEGE